VKIDELPRKAVLGYLELTRLPLTAAERALGKTEGTWPLTIATDRVQATIKDVAGTILRDETLKADARLQHAALDERTRAAEAEAEADRIRAEADDRLRREKQAADEAKAEVARRDAQRDRAVDKQVGAKKATARKVAAAQDEALEQRANNATRETLAKESSAVREQRAALEAKAEALELEDELEAARAARKQQRSG
jgi:hypothetical protein